MSDVSSRASFYWLGGTLPREAPSYVRRQADEDLYAGLGKGNFCYVLTSRQMGKSSLMTRTAVRLRSEGVKVAVLDLNALGQNLSPEQWYVGLLYKVGQELDLEDELEDFWRDHSDLGPLQRWMRAIRDMVLERCAGRVVIFIDEIDQTRSLPFSTDEFFAGIREIYNRRSEDQQLNRLTFCLLGVATPSDLIRDTRTTPFNIGQRIELLDFHESEATILLEGLQRPEKAGGALLKRILHWTSGHPYLTQRLCQAVAEDSTVKRDSGVDRICHDTFLSAGARDRDNNLLFVRDRILRSELDVASLLTIYLRILNEHRIKDDPANPLLGALRLSGITRIREGYLHVRNRIYCRVFDGAWVNANLPLDEAERQRMAERQGRLKVLKIAVPVAAAILILSLVIWIQNIQLRVEKSGLEAGDVANLKLDTTNKGLYNTLVAANKKLSDSVTDLNAANKKLSDTITDRDAANKKLKLKAKEAKEQTERAEKMADYACDNSFDVASTISTVSGKLGSEQRKQLADLLRKNINSLEKMNEQSTNKFCMQNLKGVDLYLICKGWSPDSEKDDPCKESEAYAEKLAADFGDYQTLVISVRSFAWVAYSLSQITGTEGANNADPNSTAIIARAQKDAKRSEELAEKVKGKIDKDDRWSCINLAISYESIGSMRQTLRNVDAETAYRSGAEMRMKAYEIAREQSSVDPALQAARQAMNDYTIVGDIELGQKHYGEAEKVYKEKVMRIATFLVEASENREFKRDQDQREQAKYDLAAAYLKLAQASLPGGELAQARRCLRERVTIFEAVYKDMGDKSRRDFASASQRLGNFEFAHGNKQAALDAYQQALGVRRESAKDRNSFDAQQNLAALEQEIGDAQTALGHKEEALRAYQAALSAASRASEIAGNGTKEKNGASAEQIAGSYESIGQAQAALGQLQAAQISYAEALKARKDGLQFAMQEMQEHGGSEALNDLISAYGTVAWLEVLNNHPREAIDNANEALRLAKQGPGSAWIRGNLAHGYLLNNQSDRARDIYLASRGENVNGDNFEVSVFGDFAVLRRLGITSPQMEEIETLLGKEPSSGGLTGKSR